MLIRTSQVDKCEGNPIYINTLKAIHSLNLISYFINGFILQMSNGVGNGRLRKISLDFRKTITGVLLFHNSEILDWVGESTDQYIQLVRYAICVEFDDHDCRLLMQWALLFPVHSAVGFAPDQLFQDQISHLNLNP